MKSVYVDKLKLYRGENINLCNGITIHIPTLNDICNYGEIKYYNMVNTLCSVGINLCWQLEEIGIPFDEISDFELFCSVLCNKFSVDDTKILFGDELDFSKMGLYKESKNGESNLLLIQKDSGIEINEYTYFLIVSYLREIHNLERDNRIAGTKSCRMAFIEDAKMEYESQKNELPKSVLLPMISTMVNIEGFKRNDQTVFDMNIYSFMDSVKRIAKIRNSNLLLYSGYSGFGIDLKKIKQDDLNYMGELN